MILAAYAIVYILYGLYLSFQSRQKAKEFGDSYSLLITYIFEYILSFIYIYISFLTVI